MKCSKLICGICAASSAAVMAAAPVSGEYQGCIAENEYKCAEAEKPLTHRIECLARDDGDSDGEESFKQKIEDSSRAHVGLYACIGGAVLVIAGMICLIAVGKRK